MVHGASRNFAVLSWYAGASAPGSINVRPMHNSVAPSLSISVPLRSRENFPLSLDLRRSLVSQMRREFLPVRVLHAEGHPQSGRPRCKPLNYSVASRREDQTSAIEARTRSHLEIWSVLAKSNRFVMMKLEMIEGRSKGRKT